MLLLSLFHLFSKIKISKTKLGIFFLSGCLISCSISSPKINGVYSFVIWEPVDETLNGETLSSDILNNDLLWDEAQNFSKIDDYKSRLACFVEFSDENGENDFSIMEVSQNTKYGFLWCLDRQTACASRSEGKFYVGSSMLCLPSGIDVPNDKYSVLIYDLYGNSAEASFLVGKLNFNGQISKKFEINDNSWKIISKQKNSANLKKGLFLFDSSNTFIGTFEIEGENGSIATIKNRFPSAKKAIFYQFVFSDKEMVISKVFKIG